MDELQGYIVTGIVSLVVGLLLQRAAAKPRLQYWLPGAFLFELKEPNIALRTESITIQNTGRLPAKNLEIVHKSKPDHFQFSTAIPFTEEQNANGEHITKIASLGPKEFVNIQYLSHTNLPVLLNVRSEHGPAQLIQVHFQRVFPLWFNVLAAAMMLIGGGFTAYWLFFSAIYLSKAIGITS